MAPVEGDAVLSQHELVAAPQLRKAVDVFSEHGGGAVGQRQRARGPVPRGARVAPAQRRAEHRFRAEAARGGAEC